MYIVCIINAYQDVVNCTGLINKIIQFMKTDLSFSRVSFFSKTRNFLY